MSKAKQPTPPGEMTDIDVDFISLVRKGANGQRVQIYKADDEETPAAESSSGVTGFMNAMRNFFIGKADDKATAEGKPKKSTSFAQSIAVSDIMDSMWRVNDTLREVMRNIVADEGITDKKASMSQAIDDYATYMKDKVNSTAIAKEDYFDTPALPVKKAGRTLSNKSLTSIKNAIAALQSLLDGADDGDGSSIQKGADGEVNSEEVKNIVTEAIKPITDRLTAIEKDGKPDDKDDKTVKKGDEGGVSEAENNTEDDMSEIIKTAISEAIQPIEERLDKVEKSRGTTRTLEDDGGKTEVEKSSSVFDGFFA